MSDRNIESFFKNPNEQYLASLGNKYIDEFMNTGKITRGYAVSSNENIYINGEYLFRRTGKQIFERCNKEKVIALGDILTTGYLGKEEKNYEIKKEVLIILQIILLSGILFRYILPGFYMYFSDKFFLIALLTPFVFLSKNIFSKKKYLEDTGKDVQYNKGKKKILFILLIIGSSVLIAGYIYKPIGTLISRVDPIMYLKIIIFPSLPDNARSLISLCISESTIWIPIAYLIYFAITDIFRKKGRFYIELKEGSVGFDLNYYPRAEVEHFHRQIITVQSDKIRSNLEEVYIPKSGADEPYKSLFIENNEIFEVVLGSKQADKYLNNKTAKKGFAIISNKRAYIYGECYDIRRFFIRKSIAKRIVDLSHIKESGFSNREQSGLLHLAWLIRVLVIYIIAGGIIYWALTNNEELLPIFLIMTPILFVALWMTKHWLYLFNATFYYVIVSDKKLGFDVSAYSKKEIDAFEEKIKEHKQFSASEEIKGEAEDKHIERNDMYNERKMQEICEGSGSDKSHKSDTSIVQELQKCISMYENGLLTQEEFIIMKKKLLINE